MKYILNFPIILTLSVCAPLGEHFQSLKEPSIDAAQVYIYRPSSFVGGGMNYTVMENENPIIKLYNGGYYTYSTTPGIKKIWAETETTSEISTKLKENQTYFFRGEIAMGLLVGRPKLTQVSEETALNELPNCKEILTK